MMPDEIQDETHREALAAAFLMWALLSLFILLAALTVFVGGWTGAIP